MPLSMELFYRRITVKTNLSDFVKSFSFNFNLPSIKGPSHTAAARLVRFNGSETQLLRAEDVRLLLFEPVIFAVLLQYDGRLLLGTQKLNENY